MANDAVIFGVVWGCKNKVMNPLITEDVASAIYTDVSDATYTLLRHRQWQYRVTLRWWGWAWLRACLRSEPRAEFPTPPCSLDWDALSRLGDGGGRVCWLELLEHMTGSEPVRHTNHP